MFRLFICTVILLTLTSHPGYAAMFCDLREKILTGLHNIHEIKRGDGLTTDGQLVELFYSEDKGTWTLLLSYPNGRSCLFKVGEDWEFLDAPIKETES